MEAYEFLIAENETQMNSEEFYVYKDLIMLTDTAFLLKHQLINIMDFYKEGYLVIPEKLQNLFNESANLLDRLLPSIEAGFIEKRDMDFLDKAYGKLLGELNHYSGLEAPDMNELVIVKITKSVKNIVACLLKIKRCLSKESLSTYEPLNGHIEKTVEEIDYLKASLIRECEVINNTSDIETVMNPIIREIQNELEALAVYTRGVNQNRQNFDKFLQNQYSEEEFISEQAKIKSFQVAEELETETFQSMQLLLTIYGERYLESIETSETMFNYNRTGETETLQEIEKQIDQLSKCYNQVICCLGELEPSFIDQFLQFPIGIVKDIHQRSGNIDKIINRPL